MVVAAFGNHLCGLVFGRRRWNGFLCVNACRGFAWLYVLVVVSCAFGAQTEKELETAERLEASTKDEERVEVSVAVKLEYRSDDGGYFLAPVEIDSLEGGKKYKVNITVENPTDQAISFSRIAVQCTCAKFDSPTNEILPNDFASFAMYLDTPMFGGEGEARTSAKFINADTGRVVMQLSLRYKLNKVFSLPTHRLIIELPHGKREISQLVPVILVPPLRLSDLELEVTDAIRDLSARLVEVESKPYVEIIAQDAIIPSKGMFGEILIRQKGASEPFGVLVEVKRQEIFSLSPESLRFTPVADQPGQFEATAILRLRPVEEQDLEPSKSSVVRDVPNGSQDLKPEVSVKINQVVANVSLRPLGRSGIYRVKVNVDVDAMDGERSNMTWLLRYGEAERKIESISFFSK